MKFRSLRCLAILLTLSYHALAQQAMPDSVTLVVNPKFDQARKFKRMLMGENYRKVWAQSIRIPVIHLDKEKGGLRVTGEGGGNQTSSLHLVDSSGREWVLRSVKKSISRDQPKIFQHTLVEELMLDAGSIGHPYSALAVPPMADALGLAHTNPKIVYLGDDPQLGKYREKYANQSYLFEERGPFDGTKDIKTEKLQEKIEKNSDTKVDARMILRARIFDMIVGDWDRHGGQWRWSNGGDTTKKIYEPFPTDRDKVFYTTGGILFNVMSLIQPHVQAYSDHIRRVDMWNYNTVGFDLYFLNELTKKDWEQELKYVQNALSDDLIERSLRLMPADVYAVSAPQIKRTFIHRRDKAKQFVMRYYRFLAQRVDVIGSGKDERFEIEEQKDGDVKVTISKIKKDSTAKEFYKRTFKPKETKDLRLYGLDGENTFLVSGTKPSPIKIRLIGGNDTDTYIVDSTLDNRKKLYIYDRADQTNVLPSTNAARLILKKDTLVNRYAHPENKYNTFSPIAGLGYSTEDGIQLVGGLNYISYGFQKEPYASKQQLKVNYTFQRQSFIITYKGEFKSVIGHNDLLINVLERGPRNTNNFFGLGNVGEFINEGDREFRYYRNRYDYTFADVRLARQLGNWQLSYGAALQFYTASENANQDHFFKEYDQLHPEQNLFGTKLYSGVIAGAVLDTRTNKALPYKGVVWRTTLLGLTGINVSGHTNASVVSTFSFYIPLVDSTVVLANRLAAGHTAGKAEFFQMQNLGGLTMMGYHTSRFIGNTMVFNNLELRAKLFDFNTYIFPSAFGLVAFNDAGRVWLKGESSNTVHDTYGGGIYLTPYHAFLLQGVLGKSPEGTLAYLTLGFRF